MNRTVFSTESPRTRIQLFCLLLAGLSQLLIMLFGDMYEGMFFPLFHISMLVSCILFFLTILINIHQIKIRYIYLLAFFLSTWFILIQLHHTFYDWTTHPYGVFLAVYLLALPFATITQDENRQVGLKMIASIYVIATLILSMYVLLLIADCVPGFLLKNLYWDGPRLLVIVHPNITARIFMIGIALCIGFIINTSLKWKRVLWTVITVLFFIVLSLTHSRSAILLTCIMIPGIVFFAVPKRTFKHFAYCIIAVFLSAIMLFGVSSLLFKLNTTFVIYSKATLQTLTIQDTTYQVAMSGNNSNISIAPNTSSPQGNMINDLPTLNNRTVIWRRVFQEIQNNPSILWKGTDNISTTVEAHHTHNSWLEILLALGLPGFILSLVFTVQAVWCSICLLLSHRADSWKKMVALLSMCLLMSAFVEPFLFFTKECWNCIDFFFFLCLGYIIPWTKELHR